MLEAQVGPHRQHLLVERPGRAIPDGRLRQLQGRTDRLHQGLALELGPKGITVNTIPPGMVVTPMLEKAIAEGRFHCVAGAFRQDHPGAPGGPSGGHRQRGDLPVPRRVLLCHRPSHRRQRRAANMTDRQPHGPLLAPLPPTSGVTTSTPLSVHCWVCRGEGAAGRVRAIRRSAQVRHHRPARTPPGDGPGLPDVQRVAAAARRAACAITRNADSARRPRHRSAFFWGSTSRWPPKVVCPRTNRPAGPRQLGIRGRRPVGARGHRRTAGQRPRRRPTWQRLVDALGTPGHGAHLRRRHLCPDGDGLRDMASAPRTGDRATALDDRRDVLRLVGDVVPILMPGRRVRVLVLVFQLIL